MEATEMLFFPPFCHRKECLWHIHWVSERWIQGDLHFTSPDISGTSVEECKSSGLFVQQAAAAWGMRGGEAETEMFVQNHQCETMLNLALFSKFTQFLCASTIKGYTCAITIKIMAPCLLQNVVKISWSNMTTNPIYNSCNLVFYNIFIRIALVV